VCAQTQGDVYTFTKVACVNRWRLKRYKRYRSYNKMLSYRSKTALCVGIGQK